ncbi:MAG: HlyC/CorC family transporter [Firmicutes bacterium]|mgnify:FL=1|nr:HlyC/CorC family transporter [Bacillota bacterium]
MALSNSDPWPMWGIILFIIILINAYFAAARKAIDTVNKVSVRERADAGNRKAKAALVIIENPVRYRLAIRCLNMIMYMLFSLVCVYGFNTAVADYIEKHGAPVNAGVVISLILIILVAVTLMLSLGEMLPRRIAIQHDEGVVLATRNPVKLVNVVFTPMMICVSGISFIFLKLFRQRTDINDNEYNEDNIVEMLEAGQESGELKEEGKKMIAGIFAFDDILAYEIMTPRTDMFAIDINDPPEEYIDELMELRYSRIPVYEDDADNVIGILYIKDYLIKAREEGFDNVDIKSILRKPYFVPETKNIDSLFFELQKTKQHIAILIDEYGGVCGIVTMEDLIEEVMGDIDDEYDEEDEEIKKIGQDMYLVHGSTDIDDLNEALDINLVSEDSETIGGFILDMFGEIPDEDDIGKEVEFENITFTIKSVKDRRIEEISMSVDRKPKEENDNEQRN